MNVPTIADPAESERLLRAHIRAQKQELAERMKAIFWCEKPDASLLEFEVFVRVLEEEIGL